MDKNKQVTILQWIRFAECNENRLFIVDQKARAYA